MLLLLGGGWYQLRDQAGNWVMSISGCCWSVILTVLACGVGGSDVGLCLLRGFRVTIECVAVNASVGRETRLGGQLGVVQGGV